MTVTPVITRFSLDVADNGVPFPGGLGALVKAARTVYQNDCGPHQKFYDGGKGILSTWENLLSTDYGSYQWEYAPYLCWRGPFVLADFLTVMHEAVKKFAGHYIWVCNDQEWENKAITPAEYMSKITSMYAAIQGDAELNGWVGIVPCAMGYQEFEAANKVLNVSTCVAPVKSMIHAIAFDIYDMPFEKPTFNMPYYIAMASALAKGLGVPYWLGEWGTTLSSVYAGDTETLRANRTQGIFNYMKNDPTCLGGAYWENGEGVAGSNTQCPSGNVVAALAGTVYPTVNVIRAELAASHKLCLLRPQPRLG
jgi:hypothetical protein